MVIANGNLMVMNRGKELKFNGNEPLGRNFAINGDSTIGIS